MGSIDMAQGKHVLMKHSLAKALLDAGIQHYDTGGTTQGGIGGFLTPQNNFQVTAPVINTQDFQPQLQTLQNRGNDIYAKQQNLAQALLNQSQGTGPNPALAQLNETTGRNVANTAALIGSARGASANPGLATRLAAQQGANIQQQATGQAATLSAEQELAANKELQDLYSTQASNELQGEGIQQGGAAAQNAALTTGQLGASQANAQIATSNANNAASTTGGLFGALGSVGGLIFNKGGKIPRFADGGFASYATPTDPRVVLNATPGVNEFALLTENLKGMKKKEDKPLNPFETSPLAGTEATMGEAGGWAGLAGDAAAVAPLALAAAHGGQIPGFENAIDFRTGGHVPGKAEVPGDSPKNDTQPALVSPGEEVLPRSVTMAPDAPERAKRFVEALQEKRGGSQGYSRVVKAKASLKDRVSRLEKLCAGGVA